MAKYSFFLFGLVIVACSHPQVNSAPPKSLQAGWIDRSNELATEFTLDLAKRHPEVGSQLGYQQFDSLGELRDNQSELADRKFFVDWIEKFKEKESETQSLELKTDIQILQKWCENQVGALDASWGSHEVEFFSAGLNVFNNLQILLNQQSPPKRKAAALKRFHIYVHGDDSHKPLLLAYENVTRSEMKKYEKLKAFFPYQGEIEQYLKDSGSYLKGINELLVMSGSNQWTADYSEFSTQMKAYDKFVRESVLKKDRKDPRLTQRMYAQILKKRELDTSPEELIKIGLTGYTELYKKFREQAFVVARKYQLKQIDPASVIKFLKLKPGTSAAAAEQLYKDADHRLIGIMKDHDLISIPQEPLKMRVAGEAESKAIPVPHLVPPPLVDNNGIRPEFVIPSSENGLPFDDFSSKFASIVLTAHEGRPGHDMQFSQSSITEFRSSGAATQPIT